MKSLPIYGGLYVTPADHVLSISFQCGIFFLHIWGFPKMGVLENHSFLFGICNEINHPAIGDTP